MTGTLPAESTPPSSGPATRSPGMESVEETGLAGCWDLGSNRTSRCRRLDLSELPGLLPGSDQEALPVLRPHLVAAEVAQALPVGGTVA
jgi:hypothetical protein